MKNASEQLLVSIEATIDSLESAVADERFDDADVLDRTLHDAVGELCACLQRKSAQSAPEDVAAVVTRLKGVLDSHRRIEAALVRAQDEVADELDEIRAGKRAAAHYIESSVG